MRVLVNFLTQEYRSEIISSFIGDPACQADETSLTVPGTIKVDFGTGGIKSYCLGIDIAEKVLSNVCRINVENGANRGKIEFPTTLSGAVLEAEIDDFERVLELASTGRVEYINTDQKRLKVIVPLAQWLDAELIVDYPRAIIKFSFHNYELSVTDGSALQFCTRVKEHPILSATSLIRYLKLPDMRFKPVLEYLTFWKILKSENGYKRYAQFMNEMEDKLTVTYEQSKKFRCEWDGGKVDFQLTSIGDKYPKKVVVQIDEFKDMDVLNSLKSALSLKTIELVAKVTTLNLPIDTLKRLGFIKHEDFFLFTQARDKVTARYDIGSNMLTVKQDFNIDGNLDAAVLQQAADDLRTWLDEVMAHGE